MKKIIALLLAALLTVSAGVCALAEPVTLTDQVGREVTVRKLLPGLSAATIFPPVR